MPFLSVIQMLTSNTHKIVATNKTAEEDKLRRSNYYVHNNDIMIYNAKTFRERSLDENDRVLNPFVMRMLS